MYKLVRDNFIKENDQCEYAVIKTPNLFNAYLRTKLVEEVNNYLNTARLSTLVDIELLIRELALNAGFIDINTEEDFLKAVEESVKKEGRYEDKILYYEPDVGLTQGTEEEQKQ